MRISDWSSDVCSSDLAVAGRYLIVVCMLRKPGAERRVVRGWYRMLLHERVLPASHQLATHDQIIECITAVPRVDKQHIGIAQGRLRRRTCRGRTDDTLRVVPTEHVAQRADPHKKNNSNT